MLVWSTHPLSRASLLEHPTGPLRGQEVRGQACHTSRVDGRKRGRVGVPASRTRVANRSSSEILRGNQLGSSESAFSSRTVTETLSVSKSAPPAAATYHVCLPFRHHGADRRVCMCVRACVAWCVCVCACARRQSRRCQQRAKGSGQRVAGGRQAVSTTGQGQRAAG